MAIENDGTDAQEEFENLFEEQGAHVYEFQDQKKLRGRNGKRKVATAPMPSDYLVSHKGNTHYAEVKSSHHQTSFPFSTIRPTQHGFAKLITFAGGTYIVYAKNMNTNEWFAIPYAAIDKRRKEGKQSIPWETLRVLRLNWSLTQ